MAEKKAARKQRSDAFSDLKAMYCYGDMDKKVKAGIAIEEVARWLQEDCFQLLGIKRDSLVRKLYRYKAQLPAADLVKNPPLYLERAIEKLRRGVNEVEELEKLYLLQLKRISMDAETEERITKLFSGTNAEIRTAADLLAKMMQMKQELGIVQKMPDRIDLGGGVNVGHLVDEDTDEGTKAKLGLLAGKLLDAMGKSVAEAEKAETFEEDSDV